MKSTMRTDFAKFALMGLATPDLFAKCQTLEDTRLVALNTASQAWMLADAMVERDKPEFEP